jgi:transcription elongation factor Elf1
MDVLHENTRNKMREDIAIQCPFCKKELIARFILEKEAMSRFYAYCKTCKCSIMKSVRRGEE